MKDIRALINQGFIPEVRLPNYFSGTVNLFPFLGSCCGIPASCSFVILPRELFITTDISVTLWILNQNKKGGDYHGRKLRNREHEILFMDLRTWTENPVKNEGKKKVLLSSEQIQRAADIYHIWQNEGTDGRTYEYPECYRSVSTYEIEKQGWSLVPSKYIEFIDHDLDIDFKAEMSRIQKEMREVLAQEKQSQKMLQDAFKGIGYGID